MSLIYDGDRIKSFLDGNAYIFCEKQEQLNQVINICIQGTKDFSGDYNYWITPGYFYINENEIIKHNSKHMNIQVYKYDEIFKEISYNQSNKYDKDKLMYELVPPEFEEWLAEIFTFGNQKGYKPESWKTVEPDRYYAALKRHLTAWRKGEINDQESGHNHLKHVMWNVGALLYLTENKENKKTKTKEDVFDCIVQILNCCGLNKSDIEKVESYLKGE